MTRTTTRKTTARRGTTVRRTRNFRVPRTETTRITTKTRNRRGTEVPVLSFVIERPGETIRTTLVV